MANHTADFTDIYKVRIDYVDQTNEILDAHAVDILDRAHQYKVQLDDGSVSLIPFENVKNFHMTPYYEKNDR